jgi:hypothetical protein
LTTSGLAQSSAAATELVFPFFIKVGSPADAYQSAFNITNTNSSPATVVFRLTDSDGRRVALTGAFADPFSLSVNVDANATSIVAFSDSTEGLDGSLEVIRVPRSDVVGWMSISSTQPVLVQQEISRRKYGIPLVSPPFTGQLPVVSRIVKAPATRSRRHFSRVAFYGGTWTTNTGFSIAFPTSGTSSVSGTLTLRRFNGSLLAEKAITLPPNGSSVRLLTELFPEVLVHLTGGHFYGTVELRFDQEVVFTAIQILSYRDREQWDEPSSGIVP